MAQKIGTRDAIYIENVQWDATYSHSEYYIENVSAHVPRLNNINYPTGTTRE